MSNLDLKNYSKLNKEQLAITTSKYPVYIENTILDEFVFWTDAHISQNPKNAITEKYTSNQKAAQVARLNKLLISFKDKLDTARLIKDIRPTLFKLYLSDFTKSGKKAEDAYSELLNININNTEETVYLISLNTLTDHEEHI